jgi:twitching motility protein PilT
LSFTDWVQAGRRQGASDLHLEGGQPLVLRIRGELKAVGDPVPAARLTQLCRELLGSEGWNQFNLRGSADLSVVAAGVRCRLNFYRTLRGVALAARLLTPAVKDLRACNLHPELRRLIEPASGLVVLSGPTGSGKSTTLAALIEELNGSAARHVITLESPIEYLFVNRRSYIRQREIPTHSPSFEQAIIDALRENPDVLVIGEMRTPEVIRLTLNAAETGHLVLATMHSASCAEALTRISMAFPADIQANIRAQLADCLVGVLCQRLEFVDGPQLRVPRCELLLSTSGAQGTIRAGQFSQLANVIQAGGDDGMWTFDRSQRWIDKFRDWVPEPAAAPQEGVVVTRSAPAARPPAGADLRDGTIEISIDEDAELPDLAELAKRIERRSP